MDHLSSIVNSRWCQGVAGAVVVGGAIVVLYKYRPPGGILDSAVEAIKRKFANTQVQEEPRRVERRVLDLEEEFEEEIGGVNFEAFPDR